MSELAAVNIQPFLSAVALAERVLNHASLTIKRSYEVDRATYRGAIPRVGDIDVLQLLELAADSHSVSLIAEESGTEIEIRGGPDSYPTVTINGDLHVVFEDDVAELLSRAASKDDVVEAVQTMKDLPIRFDIVLRNDSSKSNCHWISSIGRLVELLDEQQWTAVASALSKGPSVVLVEDLNTSTFRTAGTSFVGPKAIGSWEPQSNHAYLSLDADYRSALGDAGRPLLPSPLFFAPVAQATPAAWSDTLAQTFHGLVRQLVWYWLAPEVRAHSGVLAITLTGARSVSFELLPGTANDSAADLALYRWAVTGSDPARAEALHQASSLAVLTARDLDTAATPTLRTARSLYELSRRGAVAEALAARRSAREAILNSARQAAQGARQAAGKAVERVLIQLAAAIAIIFSNSTGVISSGATIWLLAATSIVTVTSYSVARFVEIPSASNGLDREVDDLDQYRDTLAVEDIEAIKNVGTVTAARSDLNRVKLTLIVIYGSAALLIPLFGVVLSQNKVLVPKPTIPTPTLAPSSPASSTPLPAPTPSSIPSRPSPTP